LHKNAFGGRVLPGLTQGAIALPRLSSRYKGEGRDGRGRQVLGIWTGRKGMEGKDVGRDGGGRKGAGVGKGREGAEGGESARLGYLSTAPQVPNYATDNTAELRCSTTEVYHSDRQDLSILQRDSVAQVY